MKRLPQVEAAQLGPLETRVLDAVWNAGHEVSVRDVLQSLSGGSAYTTVMTTLSRLHGKGLVHRCKRGRGFAYSAAVSRQELEKRRASRLFAGLLAAGTVEAQPILSTLVDAVGDRDHALLEQLEEMVRRKREGK